MTPLAILDYLGVAVFAATGALAAARLGGTAFTFTWFGLITGIGGGTLRDLLIGAPVFWVRDPGYVAVCIAGAALTWGFASRRSNGSSAMLWLDAVGMAAYAVIGAAKAAAYGVPPLVCVVMGVLTACFGGVIRDVLAGRPSVLLGKEVYVTAAALGSFTFVALAWLGAPTLVAEGVGVLAGFGLRAGALLRGWSLPAFRQDADPPPGPQPPAPS